MVMTRSAVRICSTAPKEMPPIREAFLLDSCGNSIDFGRQSLPKSFRRTSGAASRGRLSLTYIQAQELPTSHYRQYFVGACIARPPTPKPISMEGYGDFQQNLLPNTRHAYGMPPSLPKRAWNDPLFTIHCYLIGECMDSVAEFGHNYSSFRLISV